MPEFIIQNIIELEVMDGHRSYFAILVFRLVNALYKRTFSDYSIR